MDSGSEPEVIDINGADMEIDPKAELEKVKKELSHVQKQIQKLLDRQEKLQERQDELKQILQLRASEELSKVDWDCQDFAWSSQLTEVLQNVFKMKSLRPYQLSAMNATLSGQDCILIMPTGGGKSLCFQLPALISSGVTLVVSPLVSLMEDQLMALKKLNVNARCLSASCTREEVNFVLKAMTESSSELKLLYVTPEKLAKSKRFMAKLEKMYEMGRFAHLAIDEVHCCSQWGNDFRPDYKFLGIMKRQFPKVPIIGLTATSTARVTADVQKMLNIQGCLVLRASFNRPNLMYEVRYKSSVSHEVMDDMEMIIKKRFPRQTGIVYCFSIKDSETIAPELCKRGIKSKCYHAQMDGKERSKVHKSWTENEIHVVVATVAFGMGIDKPDVRFVIHHSIPKSMENFYQESGRAGRDDKLAHCILYYGFSDISRQSAMVFTEQTGLNNLYSMIAYCLDLKRCRRAVIADHFGERWNKGDCNQMCDHCKEECSAKEKDVTKYCMTLYKILEHAKSRDERMTALKLIDAWTGKGPSKLRPSTVSVVAAPREICERVVALLLLESYLKEEFHFTPYQTITYLNIGVKENMLKNSDHKIIFDMPSSKRSSKSPSLDGEESPPKKTKHGVTDLGGLPF